MNRLTKKYYRKKILVEAYYSKADYIRACKLAEDMADAIDATTKQHRADMDELLATIKLKSLQLAESYDHMNMDIKYKKGYNRVTWDTKELTLAAEFNPDLLEYKKSTPILASVSITSRNIGEA